MEQKAATSRPKAPVFDKKGRPVAAIRVSGSFFEVTGKAVHDSMKGEAMAAAAEIFRRLGVHVGG
jgi:DNA-binding IclR family transcriptional regulator